MSLALGAYWGLLSPDPDVEWDYTPKEAVLARQEKQSDGDGSQPLMLRQDELEVQYSGGTWSRLFSRRGLLNTADVIAIAVWWGFIEILGILAYPLVFLVFPNLRDRGYGLSKAIGLLFWAYLPWLLSSLRLVAHSRQLLWVVFFLGVGGACVAAFLQRDLLRVYVGANLRALIRTDLLFLGLYVVWATVRYLNPDLWHPVVGGEKPMDFAYLNAATRSTWYPPYDPWFAGGRMNYYYFGFVMIGSLIKALGILPNLAYNLAIPMLYALTGVGAYTLSASLVGGSAKRAHIAGLLGACCCVVLGNLGEARLLFRGFQTVGNINFESMIPGYPALVSALSGVWKVIVQGRSLMFRPEWWYWDATRVIPFAEGEVGPINEFPAFTFLYADLHAHMIAFPLSQAALGVALQWSAKTPLWLQARGHSKGYRLQAISVLFLILLSALVIGALRATNTWDFPTYTGLIVFGVIIGLTQREDVVPDAASEATKDRSWLHRLALAFLVPISILTAAEVLVSPFTVNYLTAYSSFERWRGSRTPLGIYLVMYGQFLFPISIVCLAVLWSKCRSAYDAFRRRGSQSQALALILVADATILITLVLSTQVPLAWLLIPLGMFATVMVLDGRSDYRQKSLWLWIGSALMLSLLVEIVVLKGDISRMNTVFKFHLQVWMLLAISAGVTLERVLHRIVSVSVQGNAVLAEELPQCLQGPIYNGISISLAGLLFLAGLYPALAIPAKVRDRWAPQASIGLDGMAYMQHAVQYEHGAQLSLAIDYDIIRWLQDNVEGSPVIMEAQAEREYLWGNRISVYTGLPSVIGWRWHQVQQRMLMAPGEVENRQRDVRSFYNTSVPEQAQEILRRYGVGYVILAPYERAYMLPEGLAKFPQMEAKGWLRTVYQGRGATIYQVVSSTQPQE